MQYSKEQLYEIGKTNYDRLALHCQTLEVAGFWEQAGKVMQQSSTEVLDLYIQSVLMKLAIHCGDIQSDQLVFIQTVPISNPLGIGENTVVDDDLLRDINRMYQMPPILIQLCSLYDKENKDDMTEYFLDALLNILICMAQLNDGANAKVNEFMQKYYNKISHYVSDRSEVDHARYIFRKLSNEQIVCDVRKKVPVSEKAEFEDFFLEDDEDRRKAKKKPKKEKENVDREEETLSREDSHPEESSSDEDTDDFAEEIKDDTVGFEDDAEDFEEDTVDFEEDIENDTVDFEEVTENDTDDFEETAEASLDDSREDDTVGGKKPPQKERRTGKDSKVTSFSTAARHRHKTAEEEEEELEKEAKAQFLVVKQRIQAREQAEVEAHEKRIQELMDELNSLVGLENVKKEIQSLINLIKIRKMRKDMHLPEMEMSYHMVFTGSPGTGKTTVARLVAKIYKELGILSEGNLVETDRSGLVAGYVGQTAIKVHEIVEQAIGGILFIDEAYSLANPEMQNDFGTEAVDTLVKLMEDHRDNLVIIVAGYTDEMQSFLKSNTGLISRFNKFIDFPDYSKVELVSIMNVMAKKAGMEIEDEAKERVLLMLEHKEEEEWQDFGNARGIRNLFEKFVMNQANRLVLLKEPTKEELITIKKEDVAV